MIKSGSRQPAKKRFQPKLSMMDDMNEMEEE
jgi:hypothetical protein